MVLIPLFIGIHSVGWCIGIIVSEEIAAPIFRLAQETLTSLKIIT